VFPPAYKGPAKCRGIDFNNCSGSHIASVGNKLAGQYSANIFVEEFQRLVKQHPKEEPLYVYLAFRQLNASSQIP